MTVVNEHEFFVKTAAGNFVTEPMTSFEFERRLGHAGGRYTVQTSESHAQNRRSRRDASGPWFTLLADRVIAYRDLPNGG